MSAPIFVKGAIVVFNVSTRVCVAMPIGMEKVLAIFLSVLGDRRVATYVIRCAVGSRTSTFFVTNFCGVNRVFVNSGAKVRFFMVNYLVTVSSAFGGQPCVWNDASSLFSIISPQRRYIRSVCEDSMVVFF